MVRETVRKYKTILHTNMGVGNEMDLDYTNFEVWKHMEEVCKVVKEEDPNHPTMLVTAGLDVAEVKLIKEHTPSLDILDKHLRKHLPFKGRYTHVRLEQTLHCC